MVYLNYSVFGERNRNICYLTFILHQAEVLTTNVVLVHVLVSKFWCNLLFVFVMISKRSNFITRLAADRKQSLIMRLLYLAEVLIIAIFISISIVRLVCPCAISYIVHTSQLVSSSGRAGLQLFKLAIKRQKDLRRQFLLF